MSTHPLARPRWIVGSVIVVTLVVLFVNLGLWQLRRLDERRDKNAAVVERSQAVVELPDDAWTADPGEAELLEHTRVRLRGRYDARREVLVRFQTREAQPGFDVVTPLVTADGVVLVERGWVPARMGDDWPDERAAAPDGEVEVEGLLAAPDDTEPRAESEDGRPLIVSGVRPRELTDDLDVERMLPLYVRLVEGDPDTYPIPDGEPDLSEGPHLNYAIQWFIFATVVGSGWIVLLARTGRQRET